MKEMKIATIVGARPQFVKAAAVSPVLRKNFNEILVHTGQHYDEDMSEVFFNQLGLPAPDFYLGIGSGRHGLQTGRMLEAIEKVLMDTEPDWVLVYGDTNSTLAGALAASKLRIPVAHIEAGLRSFNRDMPEEVNRVVTDHLGARLFAPTQTAMNNLSREGLDERSYLVGDVMADLIDMMKPHLRGRLGQAWDFGMKPSRYYLLTIHRPVNVDDPTRLKRILDGVKRLELPVVFPIHPRTRMRISEFGYEQIIETKPFFCTKPLGYLDMLALEANARAILTDSGGIQKEAYLLEVPCITFREETEWIETVKTGWNSLIGAHGESLAHELEKPVPSYHPELFGDGHASIRIAELICAS